MLLIGLWVYASCSKLFTYQLFVSQLEMHPMLKQFASSLALIIPVSELLIAILLIFSSTRIMGLYCSTILLIIFTIYLIIMILTDSHLPCGCSGIISGFSWKEHIVFNCVFILLSITGIWLYKKEKIFYKGSAKKTQPVQAV